MPAGGGAVAGGAGRAGAGQWIEADGDGSCAGGDGADGSFEWGLGDQAAGGEVEQGCAGREVHGNVSGDRVVDAGNAEGGGGAGGGELGGGNSDGAVHDDRMEEAVPDEGTGELYGDWLGGLGNGEKGEHAQAHSEYPGKHTFNMGMPEADRPEIAAKSSRNGGWRRIAGLEIDPMEGLVRVEGKQQRLRQKTVQVLLYLAEHRERVVSKEELLDRIWGGASVTEDSLVQCVTDIRKALGDSAKEPRWVRTIPKVGYRYIGEEAPVVEARRGRRWIWGAVATVALLGMGLARWRQAAEPVGPVAVKTFTNRSGQADLDWLREGLADMVETGLARRVAVSRAGSAAALVTGSFARLGGKIRIDMHLTDVRNSGVIGAEQIIADSPEQILSLVDVASMKLAAKLAPKVEGEQAPLSEITTKNLEAYRHYALGLERANAMDTKAALSHFVQAAAADGEFAMAQARIGYVHAVVGTNAEAGRPYLERAFQLSARLAPKEKLYIAAWHAISTLDYGSAIGSLRELIRQYPFEVEAHWRLGQLLRGEDRLEEAAAVMRRALVIDPNSKEAANTLGGIYSELGRHNEAVAARKQYVAMAPEDANAHDSLGLSYQWAGQYELAEKEFTAALAIDPAFAFAVAHLGDLRYRTERWEAAVEHYRRYVQLSASPLERARGYGSIAQVYWRIGKYDLAREAARAEVRENPEFAFGSAVLALAEGDVETAAKHREALFRTARQSPRGARQHRRLKLYLDGRIALRRGQAEQGLQALREALRARPVVWYMDGFERCLADAYLEIGKREEAAAEYRRILALYPNDGAAKRGLEAASRGGSTPSGGISR